MLLTACAELELGQPGNQTSDPHSGGLPETPLRHFGLAQHLHLEKMKAPTGSTFWGQLRIK